MSREAVLTKLSRVFGASGAEQIAESTMLLAGLKSLDTPTERLRFARELIKRGGLHEAIGNSIAVQSILEGGVEQTSGTFQRAQKVAR